MLEYLTTFLIALGSSTIFLPFSTELVFSYFSLQGANKLALLLCCILGSFIGSLIDYLIGRIFEEKAIEHVERARKSRIFNALHKINSRYGEAGLLVLFSIPLPGIPADVFALIAGIGEMEVKKFSLIALTGKALHFLFWYFLVNLA